MPEAAEVHLANLRQLTFGGQNAEADFAPDGRQLIFQRTEAEGGCDQQYVMGIDGSDLRLVSSGLGRTTCGYFHARGSRILYASTEFAGVFKSTDAGSAPSGPASARTAKLSAARLTSGMCGS